MPFRDTLHSQEITYPIQTNNLIKTVAVSFGIGGFPHFELQRNAF